MVRSVTFQGEHGAYSEQAVLLHYGKETATRPCKTLRDVFRSVQDRKAEFGIVPAENSIEGSINQTYDLLLEFPLKIFGETKVKIVHCLLALPETTMRDLRVVYSHPQALAQCSRYLEKLKVRTEPTYDTAGSAKMVKERGLRNAGAIASEHSAELYGLEILQKQIEDFSDNFTRFFIISLDDPRPTGKDKTTVVFGTNHVPGSLHKALGELALRRINLTRIESRPTRTTPWEYHFFVDFEGHSSDRPCAEALEALSKFTTFVRILGSYPRSN